MKKLLTVSILAIMTATTGVAQEATTGADQEETAGVATTPNPNPNADGSVTGPNAIFGTQVGAQTTNNNYNGPALESVVTGTQNNTTVNNKSYKPNGYVSNPALTTSGHDTCFGSKSGGISGPGFGISGGETVVDENCVMLKQAKLLTSLGLKDAAVLLLIESDPEIASAIWGAYPELADHLTSVKE